MKTTRLVRRVYRGWIDPTTELPKKVTQRTQIIFGNTKWYPQGVRCKITVEYARRLPR